MHNFIYKILAPTNQVGVECIIAIFGRRVISRQHRTQVKLEAEPFSILSYSILHLL